VAGSGQLSRIESAVSHHCTYQQPEPGRTRVSFPDGKLLSARLCLVCLVTPLLAGMRHGSCSNTWGCTQPVRWPGARGALVSGSTRSALTDAILARPISGRTDGQVRIWPQVQRSAQACLPSCHQTGERLAKASRSIFLGGPETHCVGIDTPQGNV
jgi:hypothetical protein